MWGVTEQEVDWWVHRNWKPGSPLLTQWSASGDLRTPSEASYANARKARAAFVARLKKTVRTPLRLLPKHLLVLAKLLLPISYLEGYPELGAFLSALKKAEQRKRTTFNNPVALLECPKLGPDAPMGNIGVYWAAYLHMLHFENTTLDLLAVVQRKALKHLLAQLDDVVNATTLSSDERGGGRKRQLPPKKTKTKWLKYNGSLGNPGVFDIHLAEHGSGKTPWCSPEELAAFKNEFTVEKSKKILARAQKPKKGKFPQRFEALKAHYLCRRFHPILNPNSANFFNNIELETVTTELNYALYKQGTSKTTSGVQGTTTHLSPPRKI